MNVIQCTILRGGSSKGIYIERDQLPPPGVERDRQILDLFGSPDVRQIDGLGGADKLTSKVAVMGAPTRADCDIDYLFGQVGTVIPRIDWTSNCGNLSAGAALYAVHKPYVPRDGDAAQVAIHQVNTGRRLLASVPLQGREGRAERRFRHRRRAGHGTAHRSRFRRFRRRRDEARRAADRQSDGSLRCAGIGPHRGQRDRCGQSLHLRARRGCRHRSADRRGRVAGEQRAGRPARSHPRHGFARDRLRHRRCRERDEDAGQSAACSRWPSQ